MRPSTTVVEAERIRGLNREPPRSAGRWVLYWMQQSQRARHNPALEHAVRRAKELDKPLLVAFALTDRYPDANLRHYRFLLEGLAETQRELAARGLRLVARHGEPVEVVLGLAREAALVVTDRGYLRHQKRWREQVARRAPCRVEQVEGDVVVPVETASAKAEHAARTLRPKIHRHLDDFLVDLEPSAPGRPSTGLDLGLDPGDELDLSDVDRILDRLDVDRSVPPVPLYRGGTGEAEKLLERFLERHLPGYDAQRNQPQTGFVSHMSKYLHFGQVSPVWLALRVEEAAALSVDRGSYLEELVVRRELAVNFVHYTEDYDSFSCLPAWARRTLDEHRHDEREHLYGREQLEAGETHDPYWNAAMREMRETGYLHNHMRMYWGKRILAWTASPEEAYEAALALNNKYLLDGRDANSYGNVGWLFGLHDRGWPEREVFGKVRTMTAGGLERKCDPRAYIEAVDRRVREIRSRA